MTYKIRNLSFFLVDEIFLIVRIFLVGKILSLVHLAVEGSAADRDAVVLDQDHVEPRHPGDKLGHEPVLDVTRHLVT